MASGPITSRKIDGGKMEFVTDFILGGSKLQYSCLENPMDGGAWKAAVHGVAKSQTRLSDFPFTFHFQSKSHICNDYWKNHSFDYMDPCWQSDVSAFK